MFSEKKTAPLYKLGADETANPMLVIDELFDYASLPELRELMWGWLKTTVAGTYHKELSASERSSLLTLYEKMEKLVEAAHVLHQQHQP